MHKTIRRQSSTTISGTLHEPLPAPPAQTVSEVPAPAQQIPAQRQDVIPRRPIIAPRIDSGLLEELKAHGTPVARMTRRDALANFSDEHKNTLHKILLEKIESDAASMTSRQGQRILKALRAYAALDLDENSLDTLSRALTNILRLLREYSPPEDNPREAEAIGYYRAYFGSRCNGSLEEPDLERVYHLDYSEKRIACPKVAKSLFTPGWTDVRQQPLFPREPSVNDIQQRDLGDCYLEAALGSLALRAPNRLKDCIRDNGDGTVTVRFFTRSFELNTLPAGLRRTLSENNVSALSDEDLLLRMFIGLEENNPSKIWQQIYRDVSQNIFREFARLSALTQPDRLVQPARPVLSAQSVQPDRLLRQDRSSQLIRPAQLLRQDQLLRFLQPALPVLAQLLRQDRSNQLIRPAQLLRQDQLLRFLQPALPVLAQLLRQDRSSQLIRPAQLLRQDQLLRFFQPALPVLAQLLRQDRSSQLIRPAQLLRQDQLLRFLQPALPVLAQLLRQDQVPHSGGSGPPVRNPLDDLTAELEKAREIFNTFLQDDLLNAQRAESACFLAHDLISTDGFTPILVALQQARSAPNAQMRDVLAAGMNAFLSMNRELWETIQNLPSFRSFQHAGASGAEPLLHPLYVTVSKEIPRVLGADVYTANALWVQMFQKAYAASGLHNADSPLSDGNRAQAKALYRKSHGLGSGAVLTPEQERQAELEWRHSYHQIIGGQSNSFLELLTGAPAQTDELEIITGKNIKKKLLESLRCPCLSLDPTALRIMDELGWSAEEKKLLSKVWPRLLEQIRRRYTAPYKKAEEDGSGWKWETYAKRAVTIEDLQWVLHDYDRWRDADGMVNQQLDPLMALCGGPNQYIEKVSVFVGRYFSELDAGPLLHDSFSAGGMPYARRAAAVYEKIQAALERNEPVCAGSHRFVPPELEHLMDDSPESLSGIVEGHAYSIVDCMEIDGRKYIILRNPWGKLEREYVRFTCPDGTVHVGTRAVKHRNPLTQSDTRGMFQMELNDFLSKFSRIYFNTPPREGA